MTALATSCYSIGPRRRFFGPVSTNRASDGLEEAPTTLGEVLDADRATPVEDEWVRIVTAIAAGDQQALRALYERAHRLVFTLAVRICGSRQAAEELTVDVFHDVWRRAATYDAADGTVVGWIMMQARSRAIDRLRFEQRKNRVDPNPDHEDEPAAAGEMGDAIDARHERSRLHVALTTLTRDERETLESAFFGERSYAETATHLDQPLGTVKTRVRSALAKLRKVLDDGGAA
jgi:RNA polymerase sigma-70 factor, ECF subfamily